MINIAVIDDQQEYMELIADRIRCICKEQYDVAIHSYTKPERLLEDIKTGIRYDAAICDIEMGELDGIELGKALKEKWPTLYLIYLTSFSQYALEGFRVSAYQYILKEEMRERLPRVLMEVFKKITENQKKYVIIGPNENRQKILHEDIVAITKVVNSKYIDISTIHGAIRERNSVELFLQELNSEAFVLVNRGEVVNLRHVTGIRQNVVMLSNKKYITVSRNRLKEIKKQITSSWESM